MAATRQILGVKFFNGDVDEAVALMVRHGGFLVAPSGTCFARLRDDEPYRRAMLAADLAIGDSGLMIVMWRLLRGEKVPRIFIPRLWNARELPWLIWKYGENLPPPCKEKVARLK